LDAARPKDGVSARDVKEGVGNHPADQILQPLEFERAVAGRHLDVAILGAFERARRHTLDEIDRARDARAQLLEGLLRVLELRRFHCGEPRHTELGHVGGDLDLARQREHVGRETRGEEQAGVVLAGDGMGMALLEQVREVRKGVGEQLDGYGVDGDLHALPLAGGWDGCCKHIRPRKPWRACPPGETIVSHFRGIAPGLSQLWAPAQLAVLAKVVDLNGFSSAARALGVPKAAVSRAIADLEQALGVRLLERTTRRLSLTAAGRLLYPHAKRVIEECDAARAAIAKLRAPAAGPLRIVSDPVYGRLLLTPLVPRFLESFPDVPIEVALDGVGAEGGWDVAVCARASEDAAIAHRSLGAPPAVLCA